MRPVEWELHENRPSLTRGRWAMEFSLSFCLRVSLVCQLAPSALPLRKSLQRLVEQQSFLPERFTSSAPPSWGDLSCCRHPISKRGEVYSAK